MSQTISWANLFIDLKDELNETAPSEVTLIRTTNRILNDLVLSCDLPESIRTSEIYFCGPEFIKYACPTGMKSMGLIDLRPRDSVVDKPLRWLTPRRFAQYNSGEIMTIVREAGTEYMQIIHDQFTGQSVVMTGCESLTADGTWTAGTGATNITADGYDYKTNGGAINFDTTGETSATISFARSAVLDISSFTAFQRVRFFMKLPTAPTGIAVRWGSDSSNYYSHSVTTQAHGKAFSTTDWNEIEAKKESATATGTPDDENIDYFALVISFSGGTTDTDFIIDEVRLIKPEVMTLEYYSTYLAQTAAGAYADGVTISAGTTDLVSLQNETRQVLLDGVAWRYLRMRGDKQAKQDAMLYKQDYEANKFTFKTKYPSRRRFPEMSRILPKLSI